MSAENRATDAAVGVALRFIAEQVGKPYVWGGVVPVPRAFRAADTVRTAPPADTDNSRVYYLTPPGR